MTLPRSWWRGAGSSSQWKPPFTHTIIARIFSLYGCGKKGFPRLRRRASRLELVSGVPVSDVGRPRQLPGSGKPRKARVSGPINCGVYRRMRDHHETSPARYRMSRPKSIGAAAKRTGARRVVPRRGRD